VTVAFTPFKKGSAPAKKPGKAGPPKKKAPFPVKTGY
jgi:hypothetical protein